MIRPRKFETKTTKDQGTTLKTFEELDLIAPLRRALVEENYTTPTPIQAQTIPPAMDGHDVLGCAQTGTGKTAAFALPILNQLGADVRKATPNRPQVLVLAPTRELAIQIDESFAAYGRHLRLRRALVYGGVGQGSQVRALDQGAHILVATPGRLIDLMNQGYVRLDQLEIFVLDEADRMLDMGFLPDLKRIISKLPKERQSLFFSATLPPKIMELAKSLLYDPVNVNVTPKSSSVDRIDQQVLFVERSKKLSMLRIILGKPEVYSAIVFRKTKRGANQVAEKLTRHGIEALPIHGNKSQNARQRALESFRSNKIQVLVATDLAARGIDIDGITHVVNFDLPVEPESYVHRIGRTARAGATGVALSLCSSAEKNELRAIEQFIGKKIPAAPNQPKFEDLESDVPDTRTAQRGQRTGPRSGQRTGERSSTGRKGAPNSTPRGETAVQGERRSFHSREEQARREDRPRQRAAVGTGDRTRTPVRRDSDGRRVTADRAATGGTAQEGTRPPRTSARRTTGEGTRTSESSGSNNRTSTRSQVGRSATQRNSTTRSASDRPGGGRENSSRSNETRSNEKREFGSEGRETPGPRRRRRKGFQDSQQARQTN